MDESGTIPACVCGIGKALNSVSQLRHSLGIEMSDSIPGWRTVPSPGAGSQRT